MDEYVIVLLATGLLSTNQGGQRSKHVDEYVIVLLATGLLSTNQGGQGSKYEMSMLLLYCKETLTLR